MSLDQAASKRHMSGKDEAQSEECHGLRRAGGCSARFRQRDLTRSWGNGHSAMRHNGSYAEHVHKDEASGARTRVPPVRMRIERQTVSRKRRGMVIEEHMTQTEPLSASRPHTRCV